MIQNWIFFVGYFTLKVQYVLYNLFSRNLRQYQGLLSACACLHDNPCAVGSPHVTHQSTEQQEVYSKYHLVSS